MKFLHENIKRSAQKIADRDRIADVFSYCVWDWDRDLNFGDWGHALKNAHQSTRMAPIIFQIFNL